jgi:uncharacterized membrane protein (DUF485 family)
MKKRYIILITVLFLVCPAYLSGFLLDIIRKVAQTMKQSIVVSIIKSKLAAWRPRLLPFAVKGRLVRDGAIISFLIIFLACLLSIVYLYRTIRLYRQEKTDKNALFLAFLLLLLSFSILGITFSMFWLGEYLIFFSTSLESLVEKHT